MKFHHGLLPKIFWDLGDGCLQGADFRLDDIFDHDVETNRTSKRHLSFDH